MTFRPDHRWRGAIAALILITTASCDEAAPELTPIQQVHAQLDADDAVAAEVTLQKMLDTGSPRADVAAYFGEAALAQNDLKAAREWLGPGEFSPDSRLHGFRMLGMLEIASGNLPAAGKAFDRALEVDAKSSQLWVDIARLRYRGGEQAQAIDAARRAVQLDPDEPQALHLWGEILRDTEGLVAAEKWFAAALEKVPGDVEIRLSLAATRLDLGLAEAAIKTLDDGGDEIKESKRAFLIRAIDAARAGDDVRARDWLGQSGAASRNVPAAMLLSAVLDLKGGTYEGAAQTLSSLASRQPDNMRVQELLAYALFLNDDHKELIYRFEKMASSHRGSTYLRTLVGRAYEAMDDRAKAASFLDRAAMPETELGILPPVTAPDQLRLGSEATALDLRDGVRAMIASGNDGGAQNLARRYTQTYRGASDGQSLLGDAMLAAGNRKLALAAYARSAAIRQNWPLVLRQLTAQDQLAGSAAVLAKFAAGHPRHAEANALLADAYAAEDNWQAAATALDRAIAGGMGRVPWVLAARSVAARALGDREGQLNWALAAHDLQPMNAQATAALIAALPEDDVATRAELQAKLRSLTRQ